MRLSRRQARALEELRSASRASATELRRTVLRVVEEFGETDGSLWYAMGEVDGVPTLVDWEHSGFGESAIRVMQERQLGWPVADPRRPRHSWQQSFLSFETMLSEEEWRLWSTSPVYEQVFRPARLKDQLRLLVYAGDRFVGWVGGFRAARSPWFRRADARRLQPLKEAIATVIVRADSLERSGRIEEACDLLVGPGGRVEFASAAGRRWLAGPERSRLVRRWVRELERGCEAPRHLGGWPLRWTRLYDGARVRYLLHLAPPDPVLVPPLARLTEAQREVAVMVASGATLPEVALATGRSPETARTHLREVYRRLGVSSRAELAQVVSAG